MPESCLIECSCVIERRQNKTEPEKERKRARGRKREKKKKEKSWPETKPTKLFLLQVAAIGSFHQPYITEKPEEAEGFLVVLFLLFLLPLPLIRNNNNNNNQLRRLSFFSSVG